MKIEDKITRLLVMIKRIKYKIRKSIIINNITITRNFTIILFPLSINKNTNENDLFINKLIEKLMSKFFLNPRYNINYDKKVGVVRNKKDAKLSFSNRHICHFISLVFFSKKYGIILVVEVPKFFPFSS